MKKIIKFLNIFKKDLIRIFQLMGRRLLYPDRRSIVFCYDIAVCIISMQLAYWLYYGDNQIYFSEFFIIKQMAIYGCLCAGFFTLLQTYRPLWKYLNFIVALILLIAVTIASGIYILLELRFNVENIRIAPMLSVIAGSASFIIMIISRLIYKFSLRWTLTAEDQEFTSISDTRILVYGHNKITRDYLTMISHLEHTSLDIVGVVVDKEDKVGETLASYSIVCTLKDIENYISELNAEGQHPHKLLASTTQLTSAQVRNLFKIAHKHNMYFQKIPDPQDVTHDGILPIKLGLEDLFTDPIYIESDCPLSNFYQQQVIMIIGAGGNIGLNLIQQLEKLRVKNLIVCESDQRLLAELRDSNSTSQVHYVLTKGYTHKHYDHLINHYKPNILINVDSITEQAVANDNPLETLYENLLVPVMLAKLAKKYQVKYFINTRPSFLSYDQTIIKPLNNILEAWCQYHDDLKNKSRFVTIYLPTIISQHDEWIKSLRIHAKQGRHSTVYLKSTLDNIVAPNSAAFALLNNIYLFSRTELSKISIQQKNKITFTAPQILTILINLFHLSRDKISLKTFDSPQHNNYFEVEKYDFEIEGETVTISDFINKDKNLDINLTLLELEKLYDKFDKNAVLKFFTDLKNK